MQKTGTANLIASWLHHFVSGWPDRLILLALFAVVAVITQFMSDAATTPLFCARNAGSGAGGWDGRVNLLS